MIAMQQRLMEFNGARLKEARLVRGFTMTSLSELTGLVKQSISNYENGKQIPRESAQIKLAEALQVPLAYLYLDLEKENGSPIFFRSQSGLAKREWEKAKVKLKWFWHLVDYFRGYLDFVPVDLPVHLDVSGRFASVSDQEIERIALETRRFWGLGDGPISNMCRLLENNGVFLVHLPLNVKEEDAFSQWIDDETPTVVNVAHSPSACRDRFSLAHELGHLIMHRQVSLNKDNRKLIESQANRFASSFLLPAHTFTREFGRPSLNVFHILKEKWKVSIKAQIYRCKQLGVLSDKAARAMYINMSKRGWTRAEPLDDILPPERPKILKETTRLLNEQAGVSFETIANDTRLPRDDIFQLLGVSELDFVQKPKPVPKLKSVEAKNNVIDFPPSK